jgi:SulP family sulfate permease
MLGAIESLLSAVVADAMAGIRHDSNQKLVGQGLANIIAPMLGRFGAKHFMTMVRRVLRAGVVILLITFTSTVFADLVVAVNIGVILATLHFLRRMAGSVEVRQATEQELKQEMTQKEFVKLPPDVLVFAIEGPLFFGAVENFERALAGTHIDPRHLIIHLKWVPFIDITGLHTLEETIRDLHKRGVNVMLSGANDRVSAKLKRTGGIDLINNKNNFTTFDEALVEAQHTTQE